MAKKATLDVLDIQPDEIGIEKPAETLESQDGQEGAPDQSVSRSLFSRWIRRPLFWILSLGLLVLVSILFLFWGFYYVPESKPQAEQKITPVAPPPPAPATEQMILAGFVVDLKDNQGMARIIFCDVALDVLKGKTAGSSSSGTDSRNLIYTTLKEKRVSELLSQEGRNRLKTELKDALNGLLGKGFVSNVYLTRFEIY